MRKLFESRVAAVAVGATVIVGLGATGATAAGMIGSDQIDNQSIKAVDIDRGAIGPSELRRGSVRSSDINPNTIQTDDINDGAIAFRDLRPWVKDHVTDGDEIRGLEDRVSTLETDEELGDYQVFTSVQNFGPGGIGGAWCGAPNANTEDEGWRVIGGGAQLTAEDVNAGVVVVSSWPNLSDPLNPGWNVQLNKPTNYNPGDVTLYAVCVQADGTEVEDEASETE